IGFGDHYWLVAILPDQKSEVTMRFSYAEQSERYQTDFWGAEQTVPPGGAAEVVGRLFAGAKELRVIEDYEERLGVDKFNLAIDFGWFYFLAKPIFKLLHIFNDRIGNFGVSILLLTLLIKIIFFPLANKSYRSMGKMKKLQPEMLKIRERYKEDKPRVNQEMMALYKKEKVNPASGCLPMIVQIPVFIALYQLLFATIEMRHAPFFWWIQDLSSPDPTNFVNLFGLLPFSPEGFVPDFLLIGIWPLVMGISMFLQQKLNPTPPDPVQAKVFMFLPLIFTFMLARFPSGLVIYWTWNNILSIGQQWVIMKRAGAFGAQPKKKAKT
ncbi:MAG: membrane protein insertase YidC, partial [Alphaproteobacteria bacterium]